MAKRGELHSTGTGRIKKKAPAVEKPIVEEIQPEVRIVRIKAIYPATIKYAGQVTGQLYTWLGAGDVQPVDERDVPFLLEKRIGNRGCCGAVHNGNKVFEQEA